MGLLDRAAIAMLPLVPGPLMRVVASRYIAGDELEDALAKLAGYRAEGFAGILDSLGEETETKAEAREVAEEYCRGATALAERGLDAYVSIKPTHLGLKLSAELAHELYAKVAAHCAKLGQTLRVEMEDRTTTEGTLRVFRRLRDEFDNVGIVLQARLFRTPADIDALPPVPVSVRMVKGIYLEPASVAHTDPEPIREAFIACTRKLFERGDHVALATHDGGMAERLLALVEELGVPKERFEFEVLMGIQQPLWAKWRDGGHKVRVYVPYGRCWRAYSTRRLKHNPEIFRNVTRQLLFGDR